ncbi:Chromatin modification-related protein EAF1 [Spathaspora sp. JA1]|nr:Chromatin modification-related protein EAF1 [Spathaspora sp. JA1]
MTSTWQSKLSELVHVTGDPFLTKLFKLTPQDETNLMNLIEKSDESAEQLFKDSIIKHMDESMFRPNIPRDVIKRKSEADLDEGGRKFPKNSLTIAREKKISEVQSLKTQEEANMEALNEFLDKSINELEILSVPEHYPLKPQTVSSLAELYYLTQTLPLIKLLPGSHKVLMTENFESALLEGKIAVLYSRIEELKRQGKWSLRQPQKYYDPFTYLKKTKKKTFYWDHVIEEAKWMAEDFKQSARFKKWCCVTIAQAVEEYWVIGKQVCINRKPIKHIEESVSETEVVAQPIEPETIDISTLNAEDELKKTVNDEIIEIPEIQPSVPPPKQENSIFKVYLDPNDLKKIDQSIVQNLPKFTAFDDDESLYAPSKPLHPTEPPIAPVSRLLHPFEEDDSWYKIVLRDPGLKKPTQGPPEYQKGLFGFQAHRRFSTLKPPKPPLIKNIEFRSPTIWLPQDDKYLIHYVAEFCFNWDLISEHLLAHSSAASFKKYESNIERRTPWQCFERYIQLNEKFQFSDMKGVDAYPAQQWLEQAHRAQSTTKRRISPLGVGTDSIQRGHRRLRWASMFDAMRKCMKKREIAVAKINHRRSTDYQGYSSSSSRQSEQPAAATSEMSPVKRNVDRVPTPGELSKLKFERDKSIQEAYLNQQATRSRMMAAVAQQQQQQQQQSQNQVKSAQNNQPIAPGSQPRPIVSQPSSRVQQQVRPGKEGWNSSQNSPQTNNMVLPQQATGIARVGSQNGVQFPQQGSNQQQQIKRPTTPNGTPLTTEQIQQLLQLQKQRRMIQQQQQQQQLKQQQQQSAHSSSQPSPQLPLNTNMLVQPISSPILQNIPAHQVPSSNINKNQIQQPAQPQQRTRIHFAPAQVSAIINSIQVKNPGFTKEQVTKLAAQYLANLQQQQQQQQQQQPAIPPQQQTPNRYDQNSQRISSQQRIAHPQSQQPMQPGNNNRNFNQSPNPRRIQSQSLTPEERQQLQMLKATGTSPLAQGYLQQKMPQKIQSASPMTGSPNMSYSSKELEERRKALQRQQADQSVHGSQSFSSANGSPFSD